MYTCHFKQIFFCFQASTAFAFMSSTTDSWINCCASEHRLNPVRYPLGGRWRQTERGMALTAIEWVFQWGVAGVSGSRTMEYLLADLSEKRMSHPWLSPYNEGKFSLNCAHEYSSHLFHRSSHGRTSRKTDLRGEKLSWQYLFFKNVLQNQKAVIFFCTVPTIPFMYSQKWNSVTSFPVYTFMLLWAIYIFMYRRPTLYTLHIAVDFLKSLRIAVVWGEGGCHWDIVHILYPCRW